MPTVSGTQKTYSQVGLKEDIEDIIYDISPTDTPMLSSIGSTTASNTLHQWQQDSLAAVAANKAVEGADAGTAATTTGVMKSAYTQIFSKTVQVSGTAEAVGKYGRASELSYVVSRGGLELKRDIEHAFVGLSQTGAAGDASTARELKSANKQISANTTGTAGSNRAFTEALLLGVMQNVFEKGGEPNQVQVTPSHASTVAGFAAASGRQRDFGQAKTITNSVDVYINPWNGETAIIPNIFMQENQCLIVDTEHWSRAVLRPMQTIQLSKTGDSDKRQMLTELTLVCEHSESSGLLEALTA